MTNRINDIDRYVGERVKSLRESLGLSQATVAAALAMTADQLAAFERGAGRFAATDLLILIRMFGVPPVYFFEGLLARPRQTAKSKARADAA